LRLAVGTFCERKSEGRTDTYLASHVYGLTVGFYEVLYNGESETSAALFTGAAFINPVKSFE